MTTSSTEIDFSNPRNLCPGTAMDFLSPGEERKPATVKRTWDDFLVSEAIPEYSGRYLTVGRESDFNASELVFPTPYQERRVWASLVKHGLTTWAARDWLATWLSQGLRRRISPNQICHTGLKDRRAKTVQMVEIQGVTAEELRRLQWPLSREAESQGKCGFFLKDIRPCTRPPLTRKGGHGLNHFRIIVRFDGMSGEALEQYLRPRLQRLERLGYLIPNFFGAQRLGPRQMQHMIGQTAIAGGFPSREGNPWLSNVEAAMWRFICESTTHESKAIRDVRGRCAGKWLYDFKGMANILGQHFKQLNLSTEYKMAGYLADSEGDFDRVFERMQEETSLWVGAWQSFWWNQVLIHKLPHWLLELERGDESTFQAAKKRVPLLMDTPNAIQFYSDPRLAFCRPALNDLEKARRNESIVHKLFLVPRLQKDRQTGKEFRPAQGPCRNAFISVDNLNCEVNDGHAVFEFDLRSGAYATTLIGLLCNISDPDEATPEA